MALPSWLTRLEAILALPRGEQPAAIAALRAETPPPSGEAWNTAFGADSLYDAWSQSEVAGALYPANAALLARLKGGARVIELGGGDGRLWRMIPADFQGELVLIDPNPEAHRAVAAALPAGVRLRSQVTTAEKADWPEADAVVASLVLHHIAGLSAPHRAAHGLAGPGKREVLRAIAGALEARGGFAVVCEADVDCEIDLAPGDPVLVDRLIDSYVRRAAASLISDLRREGAPEALRARWEGIARRWCVDQIEAASVPLAARDVYELSVPRWRDLFAAAGFSVESSRFTDRFGLFHQYVLRPHP